MPIPSSIRHLDTEGLRILNRWYSVSASTFRLVWRVLPIVLAFGMMVFRRRIVRGHVQARAPFWMFAGLLLHDVWANLSRGIVTAVHLVCYTAGTSLPLASRVAYIANLCAPLLLAYAIYAAWRRLPRPAMIVASARTDIAVGLLACASSLFTFHYYAFQYVAGVVGHGPSLVPAFWDAAGSVAFGVRVVTPAVLGAAVLYLRSLFAAEESTAAE
jgi:hypothetical protein